MFQTNNADFRDTDENLQQLAFARMRAIETGRSVVNLSTVGTSQVIAPDGTTIDGSAGGRGRPHAHRRCRCAPGSRPRSSSGPWVQVLLGWGSLVALVALGVVASASSAARNAKTPAPEGTGVVECVRRQALILSTRDVFAGAAAGADVGEALLEELFELGERAALEQHVPVACGGPCRSLWSTVAVPSPMRSRASAPQVRHSQASGTSASAAKVMVVSRPHDVHV